MKPMELVELIKKEKPQLLERMPEKAAAALIRAALDQLSRKIDAVEEGVVKVPGLGSFRVSQVDREKGGQRVSGKRIVFRAGKTKSDE